MRKQKRGIAMLLIAVMVCVELIGGTGRAAAAGTIQELTLYGTVDMIIPQDGQWNVGKNKYVNSPQTVLLEDYPITICYQDKKGKTVRQRAFTDSKGNYSARLRSADGITQVWVEIRSENDACVVADQNNNAYSFQSKKETIGSTQKSLSKKVQITGEKAKAAKLYKDTDRLGCFKDNRLLIIKEKGRGEKDEKRRRNGKERDRNPFRK